MDFCRSLWAPASVPTYNGASFAKNYDLVTVVNDPLQHIHSGQVSWMPILLENSEADGTVLRLASTSLSISVSISFIAEQLGPFSGLVPPTPTVVPALYPALSDPEISVAMGHNSGA